MTDNNNPGDNLRIDFFCTQLCTAKDGSICLWWGMVVSCSPLEVGPI